MSREFLDYVEDIIDAMSKAQNFIHEMDYEAFVKDDKTVFAVIRALEIIGEAVKKVPPKVKKQYPDAPWKDIAGMRDKLIHEYFGADQKIVWDTVQKDIPTLKPVFEKILRDFSSQR
jgi:uncharacterized protein with HEPN domain